MNNAPDTLFALAIGTFSIGTGVIVIDPILALCGFGAAIVLLCAAMAVRVIHERLDLD